MRMRALLAGEGGTLTLDNDPGPDPQWLNDGVIRWLVVEGGGHSEVAQLVDSLGADGPHIADFLRGDNALAWSEHGACVIKAQAAPTAWIDHDPWYHVIIIPETIVTVFDNEVAELDAFIQRWWLDRPGPDTSTAAVLFHVVQTFIEEEVLAFNRLRLQAEQHAEALKQDDEDATVEQLEDLMTRCHHMRTVYYEYLVLLETQEFSLSAPILGESNTDIYRHGARAIRTLRQGTEYVQRRLEALMHQHMIDRQTRMDGRVRVLTVVSAVILPLTLITGIYGMNFSNMPELTYRFSYFALLAIMVALGGGLIGFFYWKGWFR